jgi:hypothetical protein
MARSLIAFGIVAALLSAGCVPVTNPVGDINKAEPNKELLGEWNHHDERWVIDRPDVRGNPKGVMRVRVVAQGKKIGDVKVSDAMWFFTATAGKHTCANLMLAGTGSNCPNLLEEGAYAEWTQNLARGYWIGLLHFKDDTFTLNKGDIVAFEKLMTAEKIALGEQFYQTKRGWLAAYLEKSGPEAIFTGDEMKFTRVRHH